MEHPDLRPAARRMADLVAGIPDDALTNPTPCAEYSLGDLLDHVGGLALAFTDAAGKVIGGAGAQLPSGEASRLGDDWRERIPRDLHALGEAWLDADAWTGMTQAGSIDLPGEVAGRIALDELVVHSWDVAKSAGQPFESDDTSLDAVHAFVSQFSGPENAGSREGLFGPEVDVPDGAPLLDQVLGMTGRDPEWSPPGSS